MTDKILASKRLLSDAIIAAQDDPRLTEWLKNSAMINSKKGRWAEYEKAIKTLQESITDKNASPAKLLETLNNFAGGNLHQMDTVQLKRTVQQTYALARQLGQGDEYVEASKGQSQQMLAALGVNRAFMGLIVRIRISSARSGPSCNRRNSSGSFKRPMQTATNIKLRKLISS